MTLHVSNENPNDIVGGGGCLCHPRKSDETRGPYIIFPQTTTDDNLNPHAVLCSHCACDAAFTSASVEEAQPAPFIDIADEDVTEADVEELPDI